jgi:hypothetical protein
MSSQEGICVKVTNQSFMKPVGSPDFANKIFKVTRIDPLHSVHLSSSSDLFMVYLTTLSVYSVDSASNIAILLYYDVNAWHILRLWTEDAVSKCGKYL